MSDGAEINADMIAFLSAAEINGVDPARLDAVYAMAARLYSREDFESAERLFRLLTLHDHRNARNVRGLSACLYALGRYEEACKSYAALALQTSMKDPEPFYFGALCMLRLGRGEDAVALLDGADLTDPAASKSAADYKNKCARLLEALKAGEHE